jgi:spore maturation protein B
MNAVLSAVVPAVLVIAAVSGISKKVDIFAALKEGATDGLKAAVNIVPPLVALFTVIYMFRASGAMDFLTKLLEPAAFRLGIPPECVPLMLVRPLSGSGALALGADIIRRYGADSVVGRTAAVMLGSTETTFYTIAVYFGAANIKKTRYAIPAALVADIAGFCAAALSVRLFF